MLSDTEFEQFRSLYFKKVIAIDIFVRLSSTSFCIIIRGPMILLLLRESDHLLNPSILLILPQRLHRIL